MAIRKYEQFNIECDKCHTNIGFFYAFVTSEEDALLGNLVCVCESCESSPSVDGERE